jgi:aspartyl-tRNA(Asn)/glutamyl-tRNA(Gln) amidotransferase subunit C
MALDRETVLKVAQLARLQLTEDEVGTFAVQLGQVLDYVAVLGEVDTTDVLPLVHAIELSNVLRDDVLSPSLSRAEALQNAPKSDGKYFLVPAIKEG